MKNVTEASAEEDWNSLEQFMWDLEVPFQRLNQLVNYLAILFSTLGLITAANFKSGTSTTPLLITIGVSDMLNSVAGAFFSSKRWMEGRSIFTQNLWICRTSLTLFTQVSFHMSRLGFLGLAGDRYLAIVHPLKYRVWGKAINGWIATLVFLVITLIINFPFFMYTQIWPPEKDLPKCFYEIPFAYFVSLVLLNPVSPIVLSVGLNVVAAVVLAKRTSASKARRATPNATGAGATEADKGKKDSSSAENRVSVMLLVISFVSSFCDFTAQMILVYWWNFNPHFDPITYFIELFTALNAVSNFPFYMTLRPMRQAFLRGITLGRMGGTGN